MKQPEEKQEQPNEAKISLLLPAHNEAQTIERTILEFYNEINTKIPLEVIVSEDGSTDGTKEVLLRLSKRIPMKLILGEKRKGYMEGVKKGLRQVDSNFVLFVDSDGQHIASDFWKLYEKLDTYDMIVGRKIKRNDPPHRILLSEIFHLMVRALFRLPVHDPDTAYRLIKKKVLADVMEDATILKYSFWTEFTVRAFKKGFKIVEVPVIHRRRLHGGTRLFKSDKLLGIVVLQLTGLFKLWKELKGKTFWTPVRSLQS